MKYQCEDCTLIFTGLGDMTLCLECGGRVEEIMETNNCNCGSNSVIAHHKGCSSLPKFSLGGNDWREEFKLKFCPNGFMQDDEELVIPKLEYFIASTIQSEVDKAVKEEFERCVKVLDFDHSKCSMKQTCIGYGNAQSDLINNPPITNLTSPTRATMGKE